MRTVFGSISWSPFYVGAGETGNHSRSSGTMPPCPVSLPGFQVLRVPWEKRAKTTAATSVGPRELCVTGCNTKADTKRCIRSVFLPNKTRYRRHLADGETEAQVRAGKAEEVCSQARGRVLTPAWGSETSTFAQRSPALLIPSVPTRHQRARPCQSQPASRCLLPHRHPCLSPSPNPGASLPGHAEKLATLSPTTGPSLLREPVA